LKKRTCSAFVSSCVSPLCKSVQMNAHKYEILLISGIALLIYSALSSCSFNEGDSFNFAKALPKFDLVAESPHPPGYPIYIFLGRLLFSFTGNQLTALTWVSVVSGAMTLVPLYFLAKAMYNRETAIYTCLVVMVLPGFWLPSEKATTDVLSTFLVTLGVSLLYFGTKGSDRATLFSWVVYALSVGVRPTHLAFVPIWLYATLKNRGLKKIIPSALAFTATVLAWLLPVIWTTRWDRFFVAMRHVYVGTANTDFILSRPLGLDPLERLAFTVSSIFTFALGGMLPETPGLKFPFSSKSIPPFYLLHDAILIGMIACCVLSYKRIAEKAFMLLWILPHFIFVYLLGSPIHHRYYIPIFPALILVAVPSVTSLMSRGRKLLGLSVKSAQMFRLLAMFLILGTLVAHTMPLAARLHTDPSPVTQLVRHVKEGYNSESTIVIVFHEYGAFDMYAREFRYYHCRKQLTRTIQTLRAFANEKLTVLLTSTAYEYLVRHPSIIQLEVKKIAEFYIDPRAEIEDHRITLYTIQTVRLS